MMALVRDWAANLARELAPDVAIAGNDHLPLADFQERAASRLAQMVRQWGGALLADAVGLGKTRVALTVAATIAREQRAAGHSGSIWCCVPARLRTAWRRAATALGISEHGIEIVSHTALSRGRAPTTDPLVVVVDEAHRFRNRDTKRRQTLTRFGGVPILLATATPIANSVWDLYHLLGLFLDDEDVRALVGWDLRTAFELAEAGKWDVTELVRAVTVRRTAPPDEAGFGQRPQARLELVSYDPPTDEAWLWRNLEPTLRQLRCAAWGADWPHGLFIEHVLRRWESGPEALLETLGDIGAFHERWLDAAKHGRALDRSTYRSLFGDDHRQQVFGFVYDAAESTPSDPRSADPDGVRTDLDILIDLQKHASSVVKSGSGRDEVVVDLARDGRRLLVFTSYRRAARAIFDRLVNELGPMARVGLVTGQTARATGLGRTTADDVLSRFAPGANSTRAMREHETLQVLVATDCIAEGTNLQDCGRIVLADLPYTPLGIEQRVGRLLRPGGPHESVTVYLPRPRDWNDSLGMRRRLNAKFGAAAIAGVGSSQPVLGPASSHDPLAALTALDQIAVSADAAGEVTLVAHATEEPDRWLVHASLGDGLPWLFRVFADGTVDLDVAAFVADLGELVWDDRELTATEPPAEILAALEHRQRFLKAARAAPPPLALDSVEVVVWNTLCDHAGSLQLGDDAIAELRTRLLHRHGAGVRSRLGSLVKSDNPSRLLRYVESLPEPRPAQGVRLIAALGV